MSAGVESRVLTEEEHYYALREVATSLPAPEHYMEKLRADRRALREQRDALQEALAKIADEETGYAFKRDPLEWAQSIIEEMREIARTAIDRVRAGGEG